MLRTGLSLRKHTKFGSCAAVTPSVVPCNMKGRNLFGVVTRPSETSFTKCCYTVKLVFITVAIPPTVAFCENCLATKV